MSGLRNIEKWPWIVLNINVLMYFCLPLCLIMNVMIFSVQMNMCNIFTYDMNTNEGFYKNDRL